MQGKILIVDAIATNRIVLKVKLATAFYAVLQAGSVAEAAKIAAVELPDLILCSLTLPDGTAASLCRKLKTNPLTEHLPLMAVGNDIDRQERMETLEAGAQDVLEKPLDDTLLLGRVRSLIRAHNAAAEWQMRDETTRALGLAEPENAFAPQPRCALVGIDLAKLKGWAMALRPALSGNVSLATPADTLRDIHSGEVPDAFVLSMPTVSTEAGHDCLRLISALRTNGETRHSGIIVIQCTPDAALAANALDLGADDLMTDGFDAAELALRLKALLRRKRMDAQLRASVRTGLKAAVYDPLTGLYNRRYAMPHLSRIAEHGRSSERPFAVMLADLDHFKRINDLYGHASGDAVLVEVAKRLQRAVRASDMVARIGGEEFMLVMAGTTLGEARTVALRICDMISSLPFDIPGSSTPIPVTISIGMALGGLDDRDETDAIRVGEALLEQADKALYAAKVKGRNQVKLGNRPAA